MTLHPAHIDVLCQYGRETFCGVIISIGTRGMVIEAPQVYLLGSPTLPQ